MGLLGGAIGAAAGVGANYVWGDGSIGGYIGAGIGGGLGGAAYGRMRGWGSRGVGWAGNKIMGGGAGIVYRNLGKTNPWRIGLGIGVRNTGKALQSNSQWAGRALGAMGVGSGMYLGSSLLSNGGYR